MLQYTVGYFGLSAKQVRTIIREVAEMARTWQVVAVEVGARRPEITRIAGAFKPEDLQVALKLYSGREFRFLKKCLDMVLLPAPIS